MCWTCLKKALVAGALEVALANLVDEEKLAKCLGLLEEVLLDGTAGVGRATLDKVWWRVLEGSSSQESW